MPLDSDVALLGTGLAPLVAAGRLLSEGKSVLLLNPDWDFFREDSELPLDPLWPLESRVLDPERLARSAPQRALDALRPQFPGAIELWPDAKRDGFHDPFAPHVRSRSRLWIAPSWVAQEWRAIEDFYVETSDAGLNPQILEGISALKRFPGISVHSSLSPAARSHVESLRGLLIPKVSDVDVSRYRNGLLEFVRERLGTERLVREASQIQVTPEGVRFHAEGVPQLAKLKEGLLVFWTPRLTPWVWARAKEVGTPPSLPLGVRLWEEWSLMSRERVDPSIVGSFENMAAWAEIEGVPTIAGGAGAEGGGRLAVLRAGPLVPFDADSGANMSGFRDRTPWASADSFAALARLCHVLLRWEKFSVRSMRPRAIFEWDEVRSGAPYGRGTWDVSNGENFSIQIVNACDGPVLDVVRSARLASEPFCGES